MNPLTTQYLKDKDSEYHAKYLEIFSLIEENIDPRFECLIQYGILGYSIPLNVYPQGYLNDGITPVPYIGLAIQKNYISLYHMGLMVRPELRSKFLADYENETKRKLSSGKSCIRFRKTNPVTPELIAKLISEIGFDEWLSIVEKHQAKRTKK